ncbi:tail morphogenetic protein G [Staphylococcus phage Twort]|uniref:Tail morphogenetic protein G n=2 Tax=Staphylococcus phage Twort (strain DSM 17442 / HER 48) TaxID=2908167 RepID=A0A6H0X5J4_BPTWO|nr:ORF003 [Staphylococcus phage Twort]AAX92299.1 ORF003 [Staphylococcus phage Twort]QIW89122.1 tail morphogenetic protein G [Staphylococcus phage Twort]
MALNFSGSPYLDRFDPTKNRTRVLFNPDRPLQQSELNELQSIQTYYLKNFGDAVFKDGDKVSGMGFTLDTGNILKVNPGYVYLNGKVRYYESNSSVKLTKVGREEVGIKLTERIVTADEDNNLLDQTSGVPSYFSKGADRVQEDMVLTVNDPSSATIYVFQDGELYIQASNPEYDRINKVLAERTYEESGSYKVEGFEIFSDAEGKGGDTVPVTVDSGIAYVLGYRVNKPVSTRLNLQKSYDLGTAENESTIYNNSSKIITLANKPVKQVNRVTGQVLVEKESVSRDSVGDTVDYLANNTAFEIVKVWTETSPGVTTKEYKQGVDYRLTNGQSVDWSLGGEEPKGGTTYYVSYKYNRRMESGKDYALKTSGEGANKYWYLDFNTSGTKPIDQSVVLVDYNYYLARQDLIVLDKDGNIKALKGEPNILRNVTPPLQHDPFTLQLGYVTVFPDSDATECYTQSIERLSMESLQKMKTRIDNLEYNQALNALDDGAMEGQNPLTLRSVFSEGFVSLEKADVTHPEYGVAMSFEDSEATLQYTTSVNDPNLLTDSSNIHNWGRIVSAPFTEERTIYQPLASETLNVNPYNIPNKQGKLKLTPSEDNWIDEENVTINQFGKSKVVNTRRWWVHPEASAKRNAKARAEQAKIELDNGLEFGSSFEKWRASATGTMTEVGHKTLEEMIEFIRQRDVKFEVTGLHPNDNNLVLYFDGVRAPITPDAGYRKGTEEGSIIANAKGTAKGKFTIPAGIRCGNREVSLKNENSVSSTTYLAHGRKKINQEIILRTRVTVNLIDPLAQSFQYDENRIISSVGLYFASKGDANSNVTIQVREVGNQGFPTKTIYGEQVVNSSDIKVSNNASAETRVHFDDPIMVEAGKEYALVILTENDEYTMWVGTRTKPRIDKPSETISGNPYARGVLYSSSNASAWTIHQNSDLKFGIYTAKFNDTAQIEFEEMTDVKGDRLVLMSTYLTPENTGCTWEMKVITDAMNDGTTFDSLKWEPVGNYQDIEIDSVIKKVKLRATFNSNRYISPLLSVSDLTFTTFLTNLKGSYIARGVDMSEAPFNTIRLSYEAFLPQGATVTPRYSVDGGLTWKEFSKPATKTKANNEFTRHVIDEKTNSLSKDKKLKVRLDLATKNSFLRPRVRRLMVTTRDE